ncbi:ABC transporter ATP-binding protein [candidate division KSB1 bacterium]|nr:ABC transporter ATP-binding protein [candidate division KSB1 bacterium]
MTPAFEIKGLIKRYSEFQLGPLDLTLQPGIVLGYIGPNGSGKTTTMHCMTGLVKADAGDVHIFSRPNNPNKPQWKLDIGYVGDAHVFFERWSGEKNLRFLSQFYPNWSHERAAILAKRFDLPLHKQAKDLSTGNRVKLSLVAALAHSPKLLLLDEPTAGLDPVVRTEVLDTLFEILEDGERAIFYSTHILSDISRLADELAFLHDGQLTLRAGKDNLLDTWRTITFKLNQPLPNLAAMVDHRQEGNDHQIVSSNFQGTLEHLKQLSAEHVREGRMSIDEIAVHILKTAKKE